MIDKSLSWTLNDTKFAESIFPHDFRFALYLKRGTVRSIRSIGGPMSTEHHAALELDWEMNISSVEDTIRDLFRRHHLTDWNRFSNEIARAVRHAAIDWYRDRENHRSWLRIQEIQST